MAHVDLKRMNAMTPQLWRQFNMVWEERVYSVITVGTTGDNGSLWYNVKGPLLTNSEPVRKGAKAPAKPKKRPRDERRQTKA